MTFTHDFPFQTIPPLPKNLKLFLFKSATHPLLSQTVERNVEAVGRHRLFFTIIQSWFSIIRDTTGHFSVIQCFTTTYISKYEYL